MLCAKLQLWSLPLVRYTSQTTNEVNATWMHWNFVRYKIKQILRINQMIKSTDVYLLWYTNHSKSEYLLFKNCTSKLCLTVQCRLAVNIKHSTETLTNRQQRLTIRLHLPDNSIVMLVRYVLTHQHGLLTKGVYSNPCMRRVSYHIFTLNIECWTALIKSSRKKTYLTKW